MIDVHKKTRSLRKGVALILAMIFLAVFGAFAAAMASMSNSNLESSAQQQDVSNALANAESGIDCAKYLANTITSFISLPTTGTNTVSASDADATWQKFCSYIQNQHIGAATAAAIVNPATGTPTTQISIGSGTSLVKCDPSNTNAGFWLTFTRTGAGATTITATATGTDGTTIPATRKVAMTISITKDAKVLQYAIASRGRMWLAGDSTVHGNIFSAWNLTPTQQTNIANGSASLPTNAPRNSVGGSPFNLTPDSKVLGSIDTIWSANQVNGADWKFETLATSGSNAYAQYKCETDASGQPLYDTSGYPLRYKVDTSGNIVYQTDTHGNIMYDSSGKAIKIYKADSSYASDQVQGYCEEVNYGTPVVNMPGMNISDYDTTTYYNATKAANGGTGDIAIVTSGSNKTPTTTEYFPHGVNSDGTNNYQKSVSGSLTLTRYVYTGKTYTNARVTAGSNAVFKNCTFNGVLFVDCTGGVSTGISGTQYNNVRFDNCTFNGTIVTNTSQGAITSTWQKNTLYFTGSATFQNSTSAEATILAPNFNVNLGNANPVAGTNNVLRGAIVGGIVDVRGNAEVYGTIISMADTTGCPSGYVSNIGATLNDGGSETVAVGDIGTINVTPDTTKMLPSGITTPIVIKPDQTSYSEIL
jgi:hypothetical protein